MISWLQDLRYAIRQLRKSPGFTFAAIITLAVAIGANAVVFGALDALILRPLDVPRPESLYTITHENDAFGYESYMNYVDLRDRNHSFDSVVADNIVASGIDTGEGPERGWGYEASGNYFDGLGLQPYLGRFFHASDEHGPNSAPFMVLTYSYWQNHFRSDRGVIGRTVLLNKHPFTIIGVAPPGFFGTFPAFASEFVVPIVNQEQVDGQNLLNTRGSRWVSELLGRKKPGVTPAQAVADLNVIEAKLEKDYAKDVSHVAFSLARPGIADVFGGAVKAFLAGLMLLAALILLAACANLGTLFAARAGDRSREVALRLALGSSRKHILRGLFSEAVLISVVGGGIGLWTSVMLLRALSSWRPFPEFPLNLPLNPGTNVYFVAVLLALLSGFLFGAVPVRQVLRTSPYEVIKLGTNPHVGRRFTARDVLLASQIAICAVLVTSSLVALRGLTRSLHSNFGVEPNGALLVETDPSHAGYEADAVPAVQKRLIDELQTIPGVTSVGLVSPDPPLHMGWMYTNVFNDQVADLRASNAAAQVVLYQISPEYMQAAGTTVVIGRNLSWHDDKGSPRVAVVNREFARRVFGSEDRALGGYFKRHDGTRVQVVGITEDGKYTANIAESPTCAMFLPILQFPSNDTWLVVRSTRDPQQLAAAVRTKFRSVDAGLASFTQTWENEMNGALFASRIAAMSLGVLGAMGAMLSITGIFGMAAYSVSKRLRELGIRVALGAQRKEILRASLGRACNLLAFGSVAGLLLGLLASRVLSYIVYQATPRDPAVLAGVVLCMALLGLLATWIPARRALSVDPVILLREE